MARLPLVPARSTIGGFAFLLFLVVALGALLYFSYAAYAWEPRDQIRFQAVVGVVLLVLGGVAAYLFKSPERQ